MGMTREQVIEILQGAIKKPNIKDGYLGQAIDMAIKALEQEPCDDCVSRKAVLEMAKSYNTDGWDMYTPLVVDVEDIEELPPVTPQPRWIPVSERLPEANIYDESGSVWKHKVLITGYLSFDDKKESFITTAFARDVRNKCVPDTNVLAWMPLPQAYREVEE